LISMGKLEQSPESHPTLVVTTAEAIRKLIFGGQLPPGEHIVEGSIAQLLGVSHGTIRAALRALQFEGIVEVRPRRGCFVRQFTDEDVREIYTLRNALEELAAREASSKMSTGERKHLRRIMKKMEAAISAGEVMEFIDLDFEYHQAIVDGAHHKLLKAAYSALAAQTKMFMLMAWEDLPRSFLKGMAGLHQTLADAVIDGKVDEAAGLAASHNNGTGEALAGLVRGRQHNDLVSVRTTAKVPRAAKAGSRRVCERDEHPDSFRYVRCPDL
jgi:DNA-binding GntR family transcriptional regulator